MSLGLTHTYDTNLNHSLISLGQLCNDGCTVPLIIEGKCSTSDDGLWDIPFPLSQKQSTTKNTKFLILCRIHNQ